MKSTNIIHDADMGFWSPLANNYDEILNLFLKCKKMEQAGLLIELTWFGHVLVFHTPQDHLIQATCKVSKVHNKNSLFQKSWTIVYPLHKLPKLKNEKFKNSKLRGKFEIEKLNWKEGRNIIFNDEMSNSSHHLLLSSNVDENLRENISIHSSSLHSVKG